MAKASNSNVKRLFLPAQGIATVFAPCVTANPGDFTIQVGRELHCVEMTPSALFTVIMLGADGPALWAAPLIVGVLNDNIYSMTLDFEINASDFLGDC